MPIYAYQCSACGHQHDALQKLSDAPLTDCPKCGATGTFSKQVTAPSFQLKGSGWYATDFKNNGSAPTASTATSAESSSATAATEATASTQETATTTSAHTCTTGCSH